MATYEQRGKKKLWSVCFREFDLDTGEDRRIRLSGFKTKREAQSAYHDHITAYEAEKALRASANNKNPHLELTFGQLAELYFRSIEGETRDSSIITYQSKYRCGIEEFFKDKIVSDIKVSDIVEWKTWLTNKGYKHRYKEDIRTVLGFIFKFGEDTYEIKNIFKKVKGFRDVNFDTDKSCGDNFLPPKDIQKLLNATEDEVFRRFFLALYQTGCRRGEMFALRWSDVDELACTVSIDKSLSRKTKDGSPYKITAPKTVKSIRTIPVNPNLVKELRKQADLVGFDAPFLFGGENPLPEKTAENNLAYAVKAAKVRRITLHGLRHSCATVLLSKNISIVAVGKFLGHKNIKETVDRYGHLLPSDESKMAKILAEIK